MSAPRAMLAGKAYCEMMATILLTSSSSGFEMSLRCHSSSVQAKYSSRGTLCRRAVMGFDLLLVIFAEGSLKRYAEPV